MNSLELLGMVQKSKARSESFLKQGWLFVQFFFLMIGTKRYKISGCNI